MIYSNTGNGNTGNRNSGNRNTGDYNTGSWNTGYRNTGDYNAGDSNSGNRNAGDYNTGDSNSGNWNSCDYESGFFNSKSNEYIRVFNQECLRRDWDDAEKPEFIYFRIKEDNYKSSFIKSFHKTSKQDVELLLKLPNFDYGVFEEISGITKKMIIKKTGKEVKE